MGAGSHAPEEHVDGRTHFIVALTLAVAFEEQADPLQSLSACGLVHVVLRHGQQLRQDSKVSWMRRSDEDATDGPTGSRSLHRLYSSK
jgi:hypothetical protein